ncbi:hypothetical protein FBY06_1258 [Pseudomonas sp. SJZ085]|uniref:hypothetical protein n=1 Tax=unclassified Pseudomonas TaxID=196821 RepID=UPI00119C03D6|nr:MULTISPECIES: hypothetical protein [unclassified Pseudomonas]TWC14799.1 hypothetical protein FBX99_12598 [Pseudomonas sp. SJZ074]TWC33065.1 hypothetical protein FBY06_1258 [Pseudomonas sp. SJZ085]
MSEMADKVEVLSLEVSDRMMGASRALCSIKFSMDMSSRYYFEQEYQNDWMDSGGTCAFWGHSFLRIVVPFLDWEESQSARFKALVDPRYVLGASIKGKPQHVPEEEIADRIESYSTNFTWSNKALYTWYKPLGILTAHEGKHRVAFMRTHGNKPIAAWVDEQNYPAAKRIQLIEPARRQDEWLALLDGQYLQVLQRPYTSVALLREYGVESFRWHQLKDLPPEDLVRDAVYQRRLHKIQETIREADRTLDLLELVAVVSAPVPESKSVRLNLLMLDNLRFEALRYARWPGSLLALSLAAKLVDGVFELSVFDEVANGLFCAAFAMAFAPMLMEWRRRKST